MKRETMTSLGSTEGVHRITVNVSTVGIGPTVETAVKLPERFSKQPTIISSYVNDDSTGSVAVAKGVITKEELTVIHANGDGSTDVDIIFEVVGQIG